MAFEETVLPEKFAFGSVGGPGHRTAIVRTESGQEERSPRLQSALRRYDLRFSVREAADFDELLAFAIAVQGAAIGFRFKDPSDHSTDSTGRGTPAATDVTIGTGDDAATTFQLVKKYVTGTLTRTRALVKIINDGSLRVEVDGVAKTEGVDYSCNYNTGVLTFDSPPGAGELVKAGCRFHVPVRFGEEIDEFIALRHEGYDAVSIDSVPLVEIRDGLMLSEEAYAGGGKVIVFGTHISISPTDGRALLLEATVASRNVTILPAPASLPAGGPYFYLQAASGSEAFNVQDDDANGVVTLDADEAAELYIGLDGSGANIWKALGP